MTQVFPVMFRQVRTLHGAPGVREEHVERANATAGGPICVFDHHRVGLWVAETCQKRRAMVMHSGATVFANAPSLRATTGAGVLQPRDLAVQVGLVLRRRNPRRDHHRHMHLVCHRSIFFPFGDTDRPRWLVETLDLSMVPPAECRPGGDPIVLCVLTALHPLIVASRVLACHCFS